MNNIKITVAEKQTVQIRAKLRGPRGVSGNTAKAVTIQYPGETEDIALFICNAPLNISKIYAVLKGEDGASITFNIAKSQVRSDAGTDLFNEDQICDSNTSGIEYTPDTTSFETLDIMRLKITGKEGIVDEVHIVMHFEGQ